jgi:hypothetical protein
MRDGMNKAVLISLLSLLLGACATGSIKPTAENAARAIVHAEDAQRRVAAVGNEWRDTGTLLNDAREAAKFKRYAKAIELASQAERQSQAAMKQYLNQRDAASEY